MNCRTDSSNQMWRRSWTQEKFMRVNLETGAENHTKTTFGHSLNWVQLNSVGAFACIIMFWDLIPLYNFVGTPFNLQVCNHLCFSCVVNISRSYKAELFPSHLRLFLKKGRSECICRYCVVVVIESAYRKGNYTKFDWDVAESGTFDATSTILL